MQFYLHVIYITLLRSGFMYGWEYQKRTRIWSNLGQISMDSIINSATSNVEICRPKVMGGLTEYTSLSTLACLGTLQPCLRYMKGDAQTCDPSRDLASAPLVIKAWLAST